MYQSGRSAFGRANYHLFFAGTYSVIAHAIVLAALCIFIWLIQSPVKAGGTQLPSCPSTAEQNRFGVNEVLGWPGLYPRERLERSLGMMADAGIAWARTNWAWKDLQPQVGPFDYTHLDMVAEIAAKHGIKLLPILTAVPAWSSTAPDQLKAERGNLSPVDRYRPKDAADWLHYVRNVVERYDGDGVDDAPGSPQLNDWEVWNEPNLAQFWPPSPNVAEYLALLKSTYQAIKAANPAATVVLGGLANAGMNADGSSYLQALYDLGGRPYFDVVSIHVYSHPSNGLAPIQQVVTSVRATMAINGDTNKPLWLTEIGWSDAPNAWGGQTVSQYDMALFLKAVYTSPLPADLIFWYNFRNIFPNSSDVEHNFGLINADFSPKPAYEAYKALAMNCMKQDQSSHADH